MISEARKYLEAEINTNPDSVQVYLSREKTDLPPNHPNQSFQVAVYTWEGGEKGFPILHAQATAMKLSSAKEFILDQLRIVLQVFSNQPLIEFFAPRHLMRTEDYDQWLFKKDSMMPFDTILGEEYSLVLRDYERIKLTQICTQLKLRWPLQNTTTQSAISIRWLNQLGKSQKDLHDKLQMETLSLCIILNVPDEDEFYKIYEACLWAGASIIVWLRGDLAEKKAQLLVQKILTDDPSFAVNAVQVDRLRDLPQRILQTRKDEVGHSYIRKRLAILWDDPSRLPPPFIISNP